MNKIENKFEIFKTFESKMTGVSTGLSLLLELSKKKISLDKKLKSEFSNVLFYNFVNKSWTEYSLVSLNTEFNSIYIDCYVNSKIISNQLYWIFFKVIEDLLVKNNYKFTKDFFTIHDILSKFIQGLRRSKFPGVISFYVHPVLDVFHIPYLETTGENFYLFMFDFILELWGLKVLDYSRTEHSIVFNPIYQKDLINLIYCSFNPILLGENPLFYNYNLESYDVEKQLNSFYSVYSNTDINDEKKYFINDLLVSLILSSSVKIVSADKDINNIFIDEIKNVINKT